MDGDIRAPAHVTERVSSLKEMTFSDIYLGESVSFLAGVPGTKDPIPTPAESKDDVERLRVKCAATHIEKTTPEFPVREGGISYRASVLKTMNETVYVLRKFPSEVPSILHLGLNDKHIAKLLAQGLTGMVLVAGAFGQGKTTTASAMVVGRLEKHGGVAVTIEDPPEMPLEGFHGQGVCYQTWVDRGGFAESCRHAARWAPSMIFLGEVRDRETAIEALRAATNGRLVICTIHADNVTMAIERLYTLACSVGADGDDIASLMAQGVAIAIHQRLETDQTRSAPKRPKIEFLSIRNPEVEGATGAQNLIRGRKWNQLASEIQRQLNEMTIQSRRDIS